MSQLHSCSAHPLRSIKVAATRNLTFHFFLRSTFSCSNTVLFGHFSHRSWIVLLVLPAELVIDALPAFNSLLHYSFACIPGSSNFSFRRQHTVWRPTLLLAAREGHARHVDGRVPDNRQSTGRAVDAAFAVARKGTTRMVPRAPYANWHGSRSGSRTARSTTTITTGQGYGRRACELITTRMTSTSSARSKS